MRSMNLLAWTSGIPFVLTAIPIIQQYVPEKHQIHALAVYKNENSKITFKFKKGTAVFLCYSQLNIPKGKFVRIRGVVAHYNLLCMYLKSKNRISFK